MSDKGEKSRYQPVIQIVTIFITAVIGGWTGSHFQAEREMRIREYDLMTDVHCRTAELFSEAELIGNPLVKKYGIDRVNRGEIPVEEWAEFNRVIQELNGQLFKIYVTMPDDNYGRIVEAMFPGVGNLRLFRDRVLVELRRTQVKKTKYTDPNTIRHFELK